MRGKILGGKFVEEKILGPKISDRKNSRSKNC